MAQIQEFWESERCPILTGIIFADDQILYLDVPALSPTPFPTADERHDRAEATIARRGTVEEFVQLHGDYLTHLNPTVSFAALPRNLLLVGGETSTGSEGFVAVTTLDSHHLLWIAIFQESNPFTRLTFDATHDLVSAITSHNHLWKFPLAQPQRLQVTYNQD